MSQEYKGREVDGELVMSQLAKHFGIAGWQCAPGNKGVEAIIRKCYEQYHGRISCEYAQTRIDDEAAEFAKNGTVPGYVLRVHELHVLKHR